MKQHDIVNAIRFLERLYVGQSEQDTLFRTIEALKEQLKRQQQQKRVA